MKTVSSFATLPQSFTSMMYVVMFSNWPLFMDAAGEVGNLAVAKIFFYSFKVVGFYFVMPVSLRHRSTRSASKRREMSYTEVSVASKLISPQPTLVSSLSLQFHPSLSHRNPYLFHSLFFCVVVFKSRPVHRKQHLSVSEKKKNRHPCLRPKELDVCLVDSTSAWPVVPTTT